MARQIKLLEHGQASELFKIKKISEKTHVLV
jgi:hypothetical protein